MQIISRVYAESQIVWKYALLDGQIGWRPYKKANPNPVAQIPTAYKSQGTISNHTRSYLEAVHVLDSHLIRFT